MRAIWSALLLVVVGCSPRAEFALPDEVDYNFHIRPVLSDRCYQCHGPDEAARQADLRLDEESVAKSSLPATGHQAIVPGHSRRSGVFMRITESDPDQRMPPAESNLTLTDYEIALIGRWIDQGAQWKPHWSFSPVTRPAWPEITDTAWARNGLDRFVLSRLEQENLTPSPEAEASTLLRRVTLDLTGLPPTLDELDAYLAEPREGAYERAVDRLLNAPAYGEHMAAEWLDLARYADTHGYQNDRNRRMWPWRDWVVSAFNDNMPFDQFGTWQLAGDLLPGATREQILATAFNRNHRQTNEGGTIEEELRTEYVADRTNTFGAAFMGLTMECARCHDHKYDPIAQTDYYGLFSFFNNIDESGQYSHFTFAVPVPSLDLPEPDVAESLESLRHQIAEAERALHAQREAARPAFDVWRADASIPGHAASDGLVLVCDFEQLADEFVRCETGPDGQFVFAPQAVPGYEGRALSFDGESGVTFEDTGRFQRSDAFSLSLWVNPAEATGAIVHRSQAALDAGNRGYELSLRNGQLIAQLAHMWPENAVQIRSDARLALGTWTHVAMTYDGSSRASGLRLYINGRQARTTTIRDGLTRHITYADLKVPLQVAYRFRDSGLRGGAVDQLRVYARELLAFEVAALANQRTAGDADLFRWYLRHVDGQWKQLSRQLAALREREDELLQDVPAIMVMRDMPNAREAHVLMRGQYDQKGVGVDPGTPASILPFSEELPRNRLGLARWLYSNEHPLTARVAVNRAWQRFFGTGIVGTPEDFGRQGELPSHPELLDYLASTLMASGWDVKALHRSIVTSAAYRQRSDPVAALVARDPENRLLARGPRLRLTAEMIRDQALAVSGLLIPTVGGPAVKPYQPPGLWEEKSGTRYTQGSGDDLYRRTLYTFFKRTSPPPSLMTFDMPTRDQCVMRRQQTSTPMQALILLNDPQYVEAARHLAARMLGQPTLDQQLSLGFRALTARVPHESELAVLRNMFAGQRSAFEADPGAAQALLAIGDSAPGGPHDAADWAAMTMVGNTLFSYDEAVLRY